MAFTKEQKDQLIAQYEEWLRNSQAVILIEYKHMNMKSIDVLRAQAREIGSELHVTKNTLLKLAMERAGYENVILQEESTMCAFAFEDAPGTAKIVSDAVIETREEVYKIKSGYLNGQPIAAAQVKALAALPPLPVMRATLLGTILAPASKLVRTLIEPARQVAAVVKAYSETESASA